MNNIPETKYFILNKILPNHKKEDIDLYYNCNDRLRTIIIPSINELIKLHCEAQLKTILEKVRIDRKPTGEGKSSEEYTAISFEGDLGYEDYIPVEYTINEDSIINAYDLNNIK